MKKPTSRTHKSETATIDHACDWALLGDRLRRADPARAHELLLRMRTLVDYTEATNRAYLEIPPPRPPRP